MDKNCVNSIQNYNYTLLRIIWFLILGFLLYIYSNQFVVSLVYWGLGLSSVVVLKSLNIPKICISIYNKFFIIYSWLLIVTQVYFIDNPDITYFNHIDAVESFYNKAVIQVGPTQWNNFIESTLLASFYGDYPLFALWINMWKMIGLDLGVSMANMRLFLRLQDLLFASGVLTLIGLYFKEIRYSNKKIDKYCTLFGLFSYLFLTSVVFTRDLHIAFFYTFLGYYCLSPIKHKFIYLKFCLLSLVCFGLRPENGMFALVFPVFYTIRNTPPTIKLIIYGFIVLGACLAMGIVERFYELQESYNERTELVAGGGLYSLFNSLPFPLNVLFNLCYFLIMPYPLTMYLIDEHISWLGLFSLGMPFINLMIITSVGYYVNSHIKDYKILYFFILTLMYILMCCNVEPNVRRSFAVMPSLFMLFGYVKPYISQKKYKSMLIMDNIFIVILNIPAILYLISKGRF